MVVYGPAAAEAGTADVVNVTAVVQRWAALAGSNTTE